MRSAGAASGEASARASTQHATGAAGSARTAKPSAVRVRDRGQFDLMLLAIVAQGPVDGFEVASALTEQTGGRVSVPSRVVFTSLHRLVRNRLLRRKGPAYVLTDAGARSMAAKRREWRTLDNAMRIVLERADAENGH